MPHNFHQGAELDCFCQVLATLLKHRFYIVTPMFSGAIEKAIIANTVLIMIFKDIT